MFIETAGTIPSGDLTVRHGKIHPFLSSVNHLFRLGPSTNHGELLVITRLGKFQITEWAMAAMGLSHLPISLDLWTPPMHGMAAETHPAGTVGLFEIQGTQILVSMHPQGVSQFRKNLK